MPHYMLQFSYTPEAWQALAKNPVNRFDAVRELLERLGGRLIGAYYCFGEYDGVIIAELPDDATSAAASITVNAAGHNKAFKTTVLLTAEETIAAMRKAGETTYRAPARLDEDEEDLDEDERLARERADAEGMTRT